MSLNLSSATLRELVTLTEKREKLTSELSAVEAQIAATLGGAAPRTGKSGVRKTRRGGELGNGRPVKPKKRGKRGAVKELILAGLREAGEAGIAVKHLAAKLAIKPQNIHVWLHTTGKKSGLVKALGKGVYRLEESFGVATPKIEPPKPKGRKRRKAVRKLKQG